MDVYIVIRIDNDPILIKSILKVFLHEEDAISYIDEIKDMLSADGYPVTDCSYFYYIKRHAI